MPERQKKKPRASEPSVGLLLLSTLSLVLPFVGVALGVFGLYLVIDGDPDGWLLVAGGVGCIVLDLLIDLVWAVPSLSPTDEPWLNRRGAGLVGRIAVVVEPITAGRGKVRIDDSVWMAEGPELSAGTRVRIVEARDVLLVVAPIDVTSGS